MHSVFDFDGQSSVWLVSDNTVSRKAVAVSGIDDHGKAIITSQLSGN